MNQAGAFGNVATINPPQMETPTHIVKYRPIGHGGMEKAPIVPPIEERVFNGAEDAEGFATSLVLSCGAHPDSIHIYAETGVRVVVNVNYGPTGPTTAGPRPAQSSRG